MQYLMILIIDAYNLLKQKSGREISHDQREAFIHRMREYCTYKQHTAWAVFDGGPYLYPVTVQYDHVTVMYSGEAEDADQCIQRLLLSQPVDNTVLISSDAELVAYAQAYGFVSIDPSVFSYYVDRALTPERAGVQKDSTKAHKREGHESSAYVDHIMQMASDHVMYKEDDVNHDIEEQTRHPGTHTLSRHEKLLRRVLRKL